MPPYGLQVLIITPLRGQDPLIQQQKMLQQMSKKLMKAKMHKWRKIDKKWSICLAFFLSRITFESIHVIDEKE